MSRELEDTEDREGLEIDFHKPPSIFHNPLIILLSM